MSFPDYKIWRRDNGTVFGGRRAADGAVGDVVGEILMRAPHKEGA